MIAGPNGAGKTTTAMSFISSEIIDEFLNADEIARGLAPLHPESMALTASKLMLKRVAKRVDQGGHHIPEDTIRRRYYLGIKNLITHYLPLVDRALILDNSIAGGNKNHCQETYKRWFESGRINDLERNTRGGSCQVNVKEILRSFY